MFFNKEIISTYYFLRLSSEIVRYTNSAGINKLTRNIN